MAIFGRSLKTPIFWKSAKGRRRKIFQKLPKKKPWLQRPKSTLAQMALFSNLYPLKLQRLENILRQTSGSKRAPMVKLWQFRQGHPKAAFSEKVQRGDEEKFFKVRSKNTPHLKKPTALWPKWHYPLISMQLKCKDWRKLWRKKKVQKCPKGQLMAIFETSPKTRVF